MTYDNETGSTQTIEYQTDEGTVSRTIEPGSSFTFDETQDNGQQIIDALEAAGLTRR